MKKMCSVAIDSTAIAVSLLDELEKAHKIIGIALNLITEAQKRDWARINEQWSLLGLDGGTTRANDREQAIKRARDYLNT